MSLADDAHPFDHATRVSSDESRWIGSTSPDYWAFVGPFGGITAATMLRGIMQHADRLGDPLAVTVNYCAPVAEGSFDLDIRCLKSNRSTQHWSVEMLQNGTCVAFATAVFAARRPSWSHQPVAMPDAPAFDDVKRMPRSTLNMTWAKQYDFRFIQGGPVLGVRPADDPASAYSKMWIGDHRPRPVDFVSLLSISDAFFGRVFLARGEIVPFGTVSLTTYFHVDAAELTALQATHVLAVADAKVFHKSFGDQAGELWSPTGRLLATTQQIAYFKA
jgi:acyl-CoA thioesterase